MKIRIQNIAARSSHTLTFSVLYALMVWLAAGVVSEGWWLQMACLGVNTYILIELNNSNALLRIRSLMMSSVFLILSAMCNFLFPSLRGALAELLFATALLPLFHSYQHLSPQRLVYTSFLFLGLASLACVHILVFIPVLWLLCLTQLQSLTFKSLVASLLGMATPYWLMLPWIMFTGQWQTVFSHFAVLGELHFPIRYTIFSPGAVLSIVFILTLYIIGIIHFWRHNFEERIRIRQLYAFFSITGWTAFALLLFQPQYYNLTLRLFIVCATPFIAHFFTLTSSKFTNILFLAAGAAAIFITYLNLTFRHIF